MAMTPTATQGKPSAAEGNPLVVVWGPVVVVVVAAAGAARAHSARNSRTPATARLTARTVAEARRG